MNNLDSILTQKEQNLQSVVKDAEEAQRKTSQLSDKEQDADLEHRPLKLERSNSKLLRNILVWNQTGNYVVGFVFYRDSN